MKSSLRIVLLSTIAAVGAHAAIPPDDPSPPDEAPAPDGAGWVTDLESIDRSIEKEPEYQKSEQKYCLLVYGEDAAEKVWLVLDGDDLYIDRNGNGDLTEPGEKRVCQRAEGHFPILDTDGIEAELRLSHWIGKTRWNLHVVSGGRALRAADIRCSNEAATAPVLRLDGPLTVVHVGLTIDGMLKLDRIYERDDDKELLFTLGIRGSGDHALRVQRFELFRSIMMPQGGKPPFGEMEFLDREGSALSPVEIVNMVDFGLWSPSWGSVRIPNEADAVKITFRPGSEPLAATRYVFPVVDP